MIYYNKGENRMNKNCKWFGHKFIENKKESFFKYVCSNCQRLANYPENEKYDDVWWTEFWDEYKTIISSLLLFIAIFLIVFGIVALLAITTEKATCNSYIAMGIPAKWTGIWTGCMANHPKFGWIPVQKYFEIINLYLP